MALIHPQRWCVPLCLLSLALGGCVIEGDVLQPYRGLVPEDIDDGWPVATPADEGFDQAALESVYRELHEGELWQLRSLLVVRNGRLVAESYFKQDGDRSSQRAIWSCTKQFLGVLTGMALEEGVLDSVHMPLGDCLESVAASHPDKSAITLQNLLQMRSGIAYSNDGGDGQTSQMLRQLPPDSEEFILSLPMNATPGEVSEYHDGNSHLVSLCIQRRSGLSLERWARPRLFEPLGLRNYTWRSYRDGSTLGGWGILTTPRELAKLAQLVLDDGALNGDQLVSADWIAEMTSPQVDSYDERYRFGYQWWHHVELDMPFMNGHGGQYAFIDRPSRSVVVMTAEPNTQGDHQIEVHQAAPIVERILSTLQD